MRYRVVTDPDKPCKRTCFVEAKSTIEAARKGVLKTHKTSGCPLDPDNIGEIEKHKETEGYTHTVTVVPGKNRGPAPVLPQFAWLRVEGVWFWCHCIVTPIRGKTRGNVRRTIPAPVRHDAVEPKTGTRRGGTRTLRRTRRRQPVHL